MSDTERPADQLDIALFFGGSDVWMEPRKDLALQALATVSTRRRAPGEVVPGGMDRGRAAPRLSPGRPVEGQGLSRGERSPEPGTCRAWQAVSVDPATGGGVRARGEAPQLPLFTAAVVRAEPGDSDNPAASTYTNEIVLRCRPQATKKEVAEAYDRLRRTILQASGIEAGERNRLTSSPRTRTCRSRLPDPREDFETWLEAFAAYEAEHPEDAAEYRVKSSGKVWRKSFRRDTRNLEKE